MTYQELFKPELIHLEMEVSSKKDFFTQVAQYLELERMVNETFEEAIIAREEKYPTGLQLENFSIAIPHTDTMHIREPFVAINRVKKYLDFYQMGTDDVIVPVKDILVLGIKNSQEQVGLLSQLMSIFSDQDFLDRYKNAITKTEVLELFQEKID